MDFQMLFIAVASMWGASEIGMALFMRSARQASTRRDHGSLPLLIAVIAASALVGLTQDFGPAAQISSNQANCSIVALGLLVYGAAFRWNAILTLGSFFTTNVAICRDHRLVRHGIYRVLRHPSYTGTLLILTGIALSTNNWINAALVLVPCTAALLHRIQIEEAALLEAFGQEYRNFCRSTSRLLPGLY
jgi:protein-S-isoprenylcysteine O-methyltransferase Ste14